MNDYAELHCLSNFSFQRGASSARELFDRAKECGYRALAITDECSLAGIVRAYEASRDTGLKLIVGAEFQIESGPKLVLLCENLQGYTALCALITRGRRVAEKGTYRVTRDDFSSGLPGTLALWLPQGDSRQEHGAWLKTLFDGRLWLAVELHHGSDDARRFEELRTLAEALALPMVATGDVHMHVRRRRALQDVMTAIRHHRTVAEAGDLLFPNGERHLRTREALSAIYPAELMAESVRIAERCHFVMTDINYRYPAELVPEGETPTTWLRHLTEEGLKWRWPQGEPKKVRDQVEYELKLVKQLKYESYFLTVHEIVAFARSKDILCQGRGSAANSAVCYALGVTAVDPATTTLLVERFISAERNEPPDIDIDFEHERREEVIQHIYEKYGRERAALAATVISYRGRSAVRDVARALGLPSDQIDLLSRTFAWQDGDDPMDGRLRERGFDPDSPLLRRVLVLTAELMGFPRHLSQHVGGFVISDQPLSNLVPVENASMPDRTIIQWDKDDLDTMRLLKVDCLALGMLTCIRKCLALLQHHHGRVETLASIPPDDQATYDLIQRADTIGVFQIESRAQMAMLPRHRPENFYDLVIQVAIVRPGPIQGDMVHPYLRRKRGEEEVTYPSEKLRSVFERTLGVPLFQEQVMKLAIEAAEYSPGEADQLRRSMAAWRRNGDMEIHRQRLMAGMLKNGFTEEFAARLFEQIKGFGSYGFPESHAASFALLVYASCWLKCHYRAAFMCALLNAQPMGFYDASQIVQDTQRHGIKVRPVDVRHSDWDNMLEDDPSSKGGFALRLGFRQVRGCRQEVMEKLMIARARRPFDDVADLCARAGLNRHQQEALAEADALRGLAGHRHRARWAMAGIEAQLPLFGNTSPQEDDVALPPPSQGESTLADYARMGLSLGPHPLRQIRARLRAAKCVDSRSLQGCLHASHVRAAGLVTQRQRPQTASGVTFITLEDEYGPINVVVWSQVAERQRRIFLESRLLGVDGRWEHVDGVSHLIAHRLHDLSELLGSLDSRSRDFH
ncbi:MULTISPECIES: error-prone DNA polymerase [unclassified Dyella]|uniref:error-prone DNA polymerase n=1 Tax=unclassified Dyella TaxID=2634549 RepID=UPI000C853074|nr:MULTISPECIES: error-prone DNA polymerase [unclassified Dyella]MDR3443831.1 error-prone DNA polymerase [Dyella sp.]PMQ03078.1 Error-prone DNA polymerase [Dyella sp. AD56]